MNRPRRQAVWPVLIAMTLGSVRGAALTPEVEFFEKKIRPVLAEHCYECHSATSKKLKGGLHADSRAGLLKGGETAPAVTPGKPETSLLLAAISHRDPDLAMPPKKPKLPSAVIADFERWIRDGAAWPTDDVAAAPAKPVGFDLAERKQRLPWIWETPRRQALPPVMDTAWPLSSADRFILARLEKEGLQPAPPAEPGIWLRRVYFALIGLPPSPEQLAAFLNDHSPGAREWVVDRLLASPQFGERWARHWLDLVRFAESRGHEGDYVIPNAYEYRDYVIRALNADVPYDAFVREHIAGDLLSKPRRHLERGFNESILGTGWAFLGEEIHAPVDTRQDENDRIDNRIDVMSKTFLGLTVSCARCHDHKFDAISQRDYYALAGFFISSSQRLARFETLENEREVARQLEALEARWAPKLAAKIPEAQAPVLAQVKDYLVAAAEASKALGTNSPPKAGARLYIAGLWPETAAVIGRLAEQQSLNVNLLGQWTAALLNAVNNPADALHPLAALVHGGNAPEQPKEPKDGQTPLPLPRGGGEGRGEGAGANQHAKSTSENPLTLTLSPPEGERESRLPLPAGARVVLDFGKLPANQWFADGVGFGLRPAQVGEWQPVPPIAPGGPGLRLATRAAARTDPNWRELDLSPGVEREPTMYGNWKRDGVMLRSPKFELSSGKIYYLVRGSGRVLASVDSQRLVTGPVQTAQVREWGFKDHWHWVAHDLAEYAGHRVAIEFSPGNEFDTAIALIVESETPPTDPPSLGQRLAETLKARNANTIAEMAAVYQDVFTAASSSACATATTERPLEMESWLAQRPELFSGKDAEWPRPVNEPLREYLKEREPLISRVQWKSRTAPAMLEGNGVDEYLLVRGKHQTPKGLVSRRFLESIAGPEPIDCPQGSGRLQLARLMTAPENPLLARVLVNRVWHHLFGRGIVASVDNFGWLGQRPTHPELLDDLAASFIAEDHWSLKHLLRRLVLSRTFAMSSKPADADAEQRDPENLLLHRMNLQRLEGEAIRDAMLTVSGRLDLRMYGPGVPLHPSQFVEARGLRAERGPLDGDGRRSIYVAARRNFLPMMMTAFDLPTPFTTVGRRNVSNVPGQMLFLMNDPFVHQQAEVWARRLVSEMPDAAPEERLRYLYLAAFSREPSATEITRCRSALREVNGTADQDSATLDSWTEVCHALFGVKEFMYVR